jgi:hypothetical protein
MNINSSIASDCADLYGIQLGNFPINEQSFEALEIDTFIKTTISSDESSSPLFYYVDDLDKTSESYIFESGHQVPNLYSCHKKISSLNFFMELFQVNKATLFNHFYSYNDFEKKWEKIPYYSFLNYPVTWGLEDFKKISIDNCPQKSGEICLQELGKLETIISNYLKSDRSHSFFSFDLAKQTFEEKSLLTPYRFFELMNEKAKLDLLIELLGGLPNKRNLGDHDLMKLRKNSYGKILVGTYHLVTFNRAKVFDYFSTDDYWHEQLPIIAKQVRKSLNRTTFTTFLNLHTLEKLKPKKWK